MRIDLNRAPGRPLFFKALFVFVRKRIGTVPGPPLFISYRFDLLHKKLFRFVMRGTSTKGRWSKGEAESFAAFASNLQACRY